MRDRIARYIILNAFFSHPYVYLMLHLYVSYISFHPPRSRIAAILLIDEL